MFLFVDARKLKALCKAILNRLISLQANLPFESWLMKLVINPKQKALFDNKCIHFRSNSVLKDITIYYNLDPLFLIKLYFPKLKAFFTTDI